MPTCSKCEIDKPLSEYPKSQNKRGFMYHCRDCQRQYGRNHYKNNKTSVISRNRRWDKIQTDLTRNFIYNYLITHQCVDCGETDIIVLEFDHVRGEKLCNISLIFSGGKAFNIGEITAEIEKCDVRCANCHARQTAKRGNFWRYRMSLGDA